MSKKPKVTSAHWRAQMTRAEIEEFGRYWVPDDWTQDEWDSFVTKKLAELRAAA